MKGSNNSSENNQMYGHLDKEMKLEVEQSGDSMKEPAVVPNSEVKASEKKKNRR